MARKCALRVGKSSSRMVGNNVSKSNRKTRRTFLPNVSVFSFTSDLLGRVFKLKLSKRTVRTIYKHGSIDKFLLTAKASTLSEEALVLRTRMRAKLKTVKA